MAAPVASLFIGLTADQRGLITGFASAEKRIGAFSAHANKHAGIVERRFRAMGGAISASFSRTLASSLGAFAGLMGGREIARFAEQYQKIQNALKVAGLEGENLSRVYNALFQSAQKNAAPLQSLVTLYGRAALVQKELGVSSEQLLHFTDKVALALRVSGQSAEQSSGALLQLSQALGSGIVRAEEFNSILEGALPIAQAAAAGIEEAGGSVAKLRQLVVDGKVSSAAFFNGFLAGSTMLEKQAAGMQTTIGQAFTQFRNVLVDTIGRVDNATGASGEAARALGDLATAVRDIGNSIEVVKGPFASLIAQLREIEQAASKASRWFGQATGLNNVGPALGLGAPGRYEEQRLERLARELSALEGNLADARNTAAQTGLAVDRERAELIERRIDALRRERTELTNVVSGVQQAVKAAPAVSGLIFGQLNNFKPIRLADHPVSPTKKETKSTVGVDSFERALASAQKQIAVLQAETATIDANVAARERARLIVELETAARAANEAEGRKNIEVTDKQRASISALADSMYRVVEASEAAKGPLAEFAREAARVDENLENAALSGLGEFEDALVSIVDRSKSAKEAFADMAKAILSDIARLTIRQNITGPIASALSGLFGGGFAGGGNPWGSVPMAGVHFAGGGTVNGPGSGTSDSILARVSRGEFIVREAVARKWRPFLEALNAGGLSAIPGFAYGGGVPIPETAFVGASSPARAGVL